MANNKSSARILEAHLLIHSWTLGNVHNAIKYQVFFQHCTAHPTRQHCPECMFDGLYPQHVENFRLHSEHIYIHIYVHKLGFRRDKGRD
jgi:hypothetical protein